MKETFVDILGFEGKYLISNFGTLLSIGGKYKEPYYTQGFIDSTGYYGACLRMPGLRICTRIHVLVATYFVEGKTEERNHVNHINGNKLNNHYTNLEWVTCAENIKHAIRTGLINANGSNSSNSKLTDEQVLEIRKLYHTCTQKEIANRFGITRRRQLNLKISNGQNLQTHLQAEP